MLAWIESTDFYSAPASTKFHGNHEGGLLEHSLNVYDALKELVKQFQEVEASEESIAIAALFHDLAKPACFTLDSEGRGHFYGHPEQGAKRAVSALSRLKAPKTVVRQVELLVRMHERNLLPTESSVRRALWELGGEQPLRSLLALQQADGFSFVCGRPIGMGKSHAAQANRGNGQIFS